MNRFVGMRPHLNKCRGEFAEHEFIDPALSLEISDGMGENRVHRRAPLCKPVAPNLRLTSVRSDFVSCLH